MSQERETLKPAYFDAIYTANPDPWKFATSPYESAKYALTLSALPKSRYRSALEVGCSIGVFDLLTGCALRRHCRDRCGQRSAGRGEAQMRGSSGRAVRTDVRAGRVADGIFELILLSEVVYYLSREDVGRLAARVAGSLPKGGSVVLVHWTGETNYPLSGDEAAALFIEQVGSTCVITRSDRYRQFRVDVLSRL